MTKIRDSFRERLRCHLEIAAQSEHDSHTPEQLQALDGWLARNLRRGPGASRKDNLMLSQRRSMLTEVAQLFLNRPAFFLSLLGEHVLIAGSAALLAAVIGAALGVLISEYSRLAP